MKIAALISGGKDSFLAMHKCIEEGHKIECILNMHSKNPDSWMFHSINQEFVKYQASAAGIPIITRITGGEKEEELGELKELILEAKAKYDVKGISSGAIASSYQRERIRKICDELDLKSLTPLWGMEQENVIREIIKNRFEVIIIKVSAEGFDKEWLGRIIDKECLDDLRLLNKKYRINIAGEGGEYESFVTFAPFFRKRLVIEDYSKEWKEDTGLFIMKKISLE